jgi:hypothetical protein
MVIKTQHANPADIILSLESSIPLSESRGSRISPLFNTSTTHVANPYNPSTPTITPVALRTNFLRCEEHKSDKVPQTANNTTLTTRTNAAQIKDKSNVARVSAPIAINTKQNNTGTSANYISFCHKKSNN